MQKNPKQTEIQRDRTKANNPVSRSLPEKPGVHVAFISKVAVILPLHNEAENIKAICIELLEELRSAGYVPKLLLVDDGSTDESLQVVKTLSVLHKEVGYLSFSRNFGKEAAIIAGLCEVGDDYDVLAYMDSDGQHDPSDLIRMIRVAEETGADLVCGARVDRGYQTLRQRWLTIRFYKLFHILTEQRIEEGVGDFNVLRPKVVRALRGMREAHPFMKGLISWVGFRREIVSIAIRPRAAGETKASTVKMTKLAWSALLSFSSWPLRAWSLIGMTFALLAIGYLTWVVAVTVAVGRDVPGYATTIVLLLWFGGLQLFSIGILGEYVARIYDASKGRPMYLIAERSDAPI